MTNQLKDLEAALNNVEARKATLFQAKKVLEAAQAEYDNAVRQAREAKEILANFVNELSVE